MSTQPAGQNRRRRRSLVIGISVGVVVALAILALLLWRPWVSGQSVQSTSKPTQQGPSTSLPSPATPTATEAGGSLLISPGGMTYVDASGSTLWSHTFAEEPALVVADLTTVLGGPTVENLRRADPTGGFIEAFEWPGLSLTTLDVSLYTQRSFVHIDAASSGKGVSVASISGIAVGNAAPEGTVIPSRFVISTAAGDDCYGGDLSDPAANVYTQAIVLMCVNPATTTVTSIEAPNLLG